MTTYGCAERMLDHLRWLQKQAGAAGVEEAICVRALLTVLNFGPLHDVLQVCEHELVQVHMNCRHASLIDCREVRLDRNLAFGFGVGNGHHASADGGAWHMVGFHLLFSLH
jgi:hypothetical protein